MSKYIWLAGFLLLAACSSATYTAPKNLENACSIVGERPAYFKAMKRTERKWGIPVPVQMATIYQESKFIGDARTPLKFTLGVIPMGRQSSAYGYAQALDGTWEEYKEETGNRRAERHEIEDATDFIGWYMNASANRIGIARNDTRNQYLAYHEGRTGFVKGTYNAKPWLIRVADGLAARSVRYDSQLRTCGRV